MTINKVNYTYRISSARSLLKNTDGQDLIEYALLAGFLAIAVGAIMPGVASQVSVIFSKISSALTGAGS